MATKVEKIIPQEDNPALAGGVVVNGTTLPADFVIMGVGVAPATEYLKGSGIEIEKDGGVKVDKYLRVQSGSDRKNIYAIGMFFLLFAGLLLIFKIQVTLPFIHSLVEISQGLSIGMWV